MRSLLSLALVLAFSVTLHAATQTVTLKPGWNSVWLEIDADNAEPDAVFAGLPIDQVWCYLAPARAVQFIDDPAAGKWNVESWRSWRPAGHAEAFLNNLGTVLGGRAYLIKLSGTVNATLTLNGTPVVRALSWMADSFNFVGFPMDPATSGQLATSFFSGISELQTSAKYKLTTAGTWTAFTSSDRIKSGEAYWIFSNGAAQFSGPVRLSAGELIYPVRSEEQTLILRNDSPFAVTVTVENTDALPLLIATTNPADERTKWQLWASTVFNVPANGENSLRLGARRTGLTSTVAGALKISGGGALLKTPVRIEVEPATLAASGHVGLWAGTVTLDAVTDVNNSPTTPVPSAGTLGMRVLLHVAANGSVKLLKQVTLMKKIEPASTVQHFALITDDTKLASFTGATLKDGKPFGSRLSAIGYDFAGNELALSGAFGGTLSGTITLDRSLPTHPMRHKYHPDHDDRDAQFQPLPVPYPANFTPDKQEVWDITRALQITFDPPSATLTPGQGTTTASATYRETISGLHKLNIIVSGKLDLQRVNAIGELNPAP